MFFILPIIKFLSPILIPIFKFLRKILWDATLRKFFNDTLKLTLIVSLVDDYLDIIIGILEDPYSIVKFTKTSLLIIFAPWIIQLVLLPIKKLQQSRMIAMQTQQMGYYNQPLDYNQEYYNQLAQTNPEYYQQLLYQQQMGGRFGALNLLSNSPGIYDYLSIYVFIIILYMIEKREICNEDNKESEKKYDFLKILKLGAVISIFITIFYISNYLIFPFIPIVGLFFKIATSLPIIGTLVPGITTYFAYNIFRNMTELLKNRTKCF